MRYQVLACDYDGTLALNGRVSQSTVAALKRWLDAKRTLILVTGRELPQLIDIFPELGLCHRVVAENGALLYRPATQQSVSLSEPPPESLIAAVKKRNIPVSIGRSILATWLPHEVEMLEAIQEAGVEWHLIFNKEAVMALPTNVNKASGLNVALAELGLAAENVVGVGDGENDHALLKMCGFGVAVANAVPALKETATWTTPGDHGTGVEQLIEKILVDDPNT